MGLALGIILLIAIIALANMLTAANNETYNRLFDRFLLLAHIPLIVVGLGLTMVSADMAAAMRRSGVLLEDFNGAGLLLVAMAAWAILSSLRSFRIFLTRWLPLNPASPVHSLALVLSGYLVGNTLITLTQGGLEALVESAVSPTIVDVVIQGALFVLLALFGVGFLIRRHGGRLWGRLGLEQPTRPQLWMGVRWIIFLVVVQWLVGAIWTVVDPTQSDLLNSITEELVRDFDTVGEWFLLALSAGIGEELLFRGALQPVFGLGFTAVLFAVAHVQYGLTPITLVVLIIGIVLGYIRQRSNTTVAIFVHFGYNFVLGLLSLLAMYLQQFIS